MLTIFKLMWRNLVQGPSTEPFPFGETTTPERLRGKVAVDAKACTGCEVCISVCAGGALRQEERADGSGKDFYVWHNTCAFCGLCQEYCPTGAIRLTTDWSTVHLNQDKYTYREQVFIAHASCEQCSARMPRMPHGTIETIYGRTNPHLDTLYRLCPQCRREKAAIQLGANFHE
ncbi:MAG TPA: 4Fe-4S dicluster domain-containing protein [Desulfomicrobiaceae bacterium]|jgi:formate hydrogenlyase subunit 6/NADH:ubiquinone oxidoreductase subunit I|nr:4Fe-4S dicluster domain-containing protein [Desulfomicrobiaceae bacterium]